MRIRILVLSFVFDKRCRLFKAPLPLPWFIRVRLMCRGFLFDFVLCVLFFFVLPWFSLLFACIFISHFHFTFSISIFIQFILMPFKAARALASSACKMRSTAAAAVGAATPFGIPGLQTLFSRELTWYMANDVDSARDRDRGERKRESQHNGWRWSVGVVINTCLYVSLLQQAHWAPSQWKNKCSIEIKAHWMPHAIVSRWLNYRWAGETFLRL